jgi:hypothetical protein
LLSAAAAVRVVLERKGKKRRYARAGTLTARGRRGTNKLAVSGRRLKTGRYRATVTPTDGSGNVSRPVRAMFVVG